MNKIGVQSVVDRNWRSWRDHETDHHRRPAPRVFRFSRTDRGIPQNAQAKSSNPFASRCTSGMLQASLPAGLLAFGCTIQLSLSYGSSWMLSRFPAFDLYLWFLSIALECGLAAMVCLPGARRRFPWFSRYAMASAIASIALLVAAAASSLSAYEVISFTWSGVSAAISVFVLAELWRRILGPKFTLPDWVLRDFIKSLIIVSAATWPVAFIVDMALGPHPFAGFLVTCSTLDEIAEGVILTALICMLLHARSLRLKAGESESGIAYGFVAILLAGLLTDAIRSHASIAAAVMAQRASQFVYCACLLLWARSLKHREESESMVTMEEIEEQSEKLVPIERELRLRA